tara:strand:- start:1157 stop:1519 length:363 start_codon:yes stop_codon:yes gene_type:complete
VQTQIFGFAAGKSVRDLNCERIKLSKTLYDMGMKVAAVSLMCQDKRVWNAMRMAGTPCPYEGALGDEALASWEVNTDRMPSGAYDIKKKDGTLKDDPETDYNVYSKEEFCARYPKEPICN